MQERQQPDERDSDYPEEGYCGESLRGCLILGLIRFRCRQDSTRFFIYSTKFFGTFK